VHLPAEGVDRVHRVATVRGKKEERVVEIAAATLGERGAVGLGFLARHGDGMPADQAVMGSDALPPGDDAQTGRDGTARPAAPRLPPFAPFPVPSGPRSTAVPAIRGRPPGGDAPRELGPAPWRPGFSARRPAGGLAHPVRWLCRWLRCRGTRPPRRRD